VATSEPVVSQEARRGARVLGSVDQVRELSAGRHGKREADWFWRAANEAEGLRLIRSEAYGPQ